MQMDLSPDFIGNSQFYAYLTNPHPLELSENDWAKKVISLVVDLTRDLYSNGRAFERLGSVVEFARKGFSDKG